MGWNKDGRTIRAEYCGTTFDGIVLSSRGKFGGKAQYQVQSEPFWVDALQAYREVVLVDEDDVLVDFGVLSEVE